MLLTEKVSQFANDSDTVHAWVNGPASGIGSSVSTSAGLVRTPAKLIADKAADVDAATNAAIAGNLALVSTVANSIGNVNAVGAKLPVLQTVLDNLALLNAVDSNIVAVQTVANSIIAVDSAYENLGVIQASPANAAISADSAAYLASYIDNVVMNITFPLDLGLIADPVAPFNIFDLGAL